MQTQRSLWRDATLLFLLFLPISLLATTEKVSKQYDLLPSKTYFIDLEIDAAEIEVMRGEAHQLRLELRFTKDAFSYDIDFDEKAGEMRIYFDKEDWVEEDFDGTIAEFNLYLPHNVELRLNSSIKAGEVAFELGGMKIAKFELKTWAGEVTVGFEKPNKIQMKTFHLNTKVGETRLRDLGNARFEYADINSGIGKLDIDFRGEFVSETTAEIDLDIGETDIYLPEEIGTRIVVKKFLFLSDVNISGDYRKSGRYYVSENYDNASRKFDLRINPGIGALHVSSR